MKRSTKKLLVVLLLLALIIPSAVVVMAQDEGDEDEEIVEIVLPEVDPLDVTGDIVTAGSSTVFPLSERMAERFEEDGYMGEITIDSIGSGAGFERFCV